MNGSLRQPFRIGDWDVYPRENLLRRAREEHALEPKVMDVLALLAGNQGEVVSREEILDAVWADVVVGDEVVTRAVSLLRTAFGDDQKHPVYLRTVPKRGYSLVADVEPLSADGSNGKPISRGQASMRRQLSFLAVALVAVVGAYLTADQIRTRPSFQDVLDGTALSIAVRPFVSMADDPGDTYFADGLSEELLNLLAGVPEFRVVARTSSFAYRGESADVVAMGKNLGVSYVLEGSVRAADNRIRVSARLVGTDGGLLLWSEMYDRAISDVFSIQDEIATAVVNALKLELLGEMPAPYATEPEAYALYLQGLFFENQKGIEGYRKSAEALTRALEIDSEYAPAWSLLSKVYTYQVRSGMLPRERGRALAMEAVETALGLDEAMAPAWANLAYLKSFYDWDWDGAMIALDRAMALEPNNAQVLGVAASLAGRLGRATLATELHERTLAQDPLNATALSAMGQDYLRNRQLDEAIRVFERLAALNPEHYSVYTNLGRAWLLKGNAERALAEIEKSRSERLKSFETIQVHLALDDRARVQLLVNEYLDQHARADVIRTAALFASLGDKDSAFEWLEKAYDRRDPRLTWMLVDIDLKNLEDDPRYPEFLARIGLREAWEAMPNYGVSHLISVEK